MSLSAFLAPCDHDDVVSVACYHSSNTLRWLCREPLVRNRP